MGIMEKKMETTIVQKGIHRLEVFIGIMERKMETAVVY